MKEPREELIIGTINLSPDSYDNYIGECEIRVYSNEYAYPHFHIIPKNVKGECCICIYKASYYFDHCYNREIKLNKDQINILNEWLKTKYEYLPNASNWDVISVMWIIENGIKNVPENRVQPDYTNIT